jgi:hypothetical protein
MKVTRATCIEEWNRLWDLAASTTEHVQGDAAAREPLQLLIGALVYHRKALDGFSDSLLHDRVRQDPTLMDALLSEREAALSDAHSIIGGMHLASAALRIPTAVLETIDARLSTGTSFDEFLRSENGRPYDWNRGKCSELFENPSLSDHCSGTSLTCGESLVILLLFREDFAHGEEGRVEGRRPGNTKREYWIKTRQERLDSIYRCRALEAQRLLIEWGLKTLRGP